MKRRAKKIAAVSLAAVCVLSAIYWAITFEITLQTDGAGALSADKQRVHLFQSVKIRVTPSDAPEATVLNRITVNGADCTERVHLQTLKIRCVWQDTVVYAEFASAAEKTVRANAPIFV